MINPLDKVIELLNEMDIEPTNSSKIKSYILEAQEEIEAIKCKMFLEGFKNSAEGYNGEHPSRNDKQIWESIQDDYIQVNQQ